MALGYKSIAISELKGGEILDLHGNLHRVETTIQGYAGGWTIIVKSGDGETIPYNYAKDFFVNQVVHV